MVKPVAIGQRLVGHGYPVFIIAEAGINHNGRLDLALEMVDQAAKTGADAIKFQTFKAEKEISSDAPKADYQLKTTDPAESQLEMAKKLELSESEFEQIFHFCQKRKIMFLSTPFDEESADFLEKLGVDAFKTSSGDLTNLPLLAHIAAKRRPMIISTGMANFEEIERSLNIVCESGPAPIALLHCVSSYPAPEREINLRCLTMMAEKFHLLVGFSDHTKGLEIAIAATALGVCVIEKHFTLDRKMAGPDHRMSLEPNEFVKLVKAIRHVESAMGDGIKRPQPSELNVMAIARRSIVAARDLPQGIHLATGDLVLKRPGTGLDSRYIPEMMGRMTKRAISKDQLIDWSMLSDG